MWIVTEVCSNQWFLLELVLMTWKVMRRKAWKNIANLREQNYWAVEIKSQRHAWMITIFKRRCLLTNCSDMSVCLVRIGEDPIFVWSVNKLSRAVTKWRKSCDKRLARLISYIHHACRIQATLFCDKHSTTMQIRIVSRLWFCRRLWRLQVNIGRNSVYSRKSNNCTNKLDVQETDLGLTQFNRSRAHISWCRFTHGWNTSSWSLGLGYWSLSSFSKPIKENIESMRRLVA